VPPCPHLDSQYAVDGLVMHNPLPVNLPYVHLHSTRTHGRTHNTGGSRRTHHPHPHPPCACTLGQPSRASGSEAAKHDAHLLRAGRRASRRAQHQGKGLPSARVPAPRSTSCPTRRHTVRSAATTARVPSALLAPRTTADLLRASWLHGTCIASHCPTSNAVSVPAALPINSVCRCNGVRVKWGGGREGDPSESPVANRTRSHHTHDPPPTMVAAHTRTHLHVGVGPPDAGGHEVQRHSHA
jgi:hypothetical protein